MIAPVTVCLLVGALCFSIGGLLVVAAALVGVSVLIEFFLPSAAA